jgi:protein disulfide-isomerase A4
VEWLDEKTNPNYKPPPEEVVTLTKETMDAFIADKPLVLLAFTAPWCGTFLITYIFSLIFCLGHCKQLVPHFEKAAQKLKVSINR